MTAGRNARPHHSTKTAQELHENGTEITQELHGTEITLELHENGTEITLELHEKAGRQKITGRAREPQQEHNRHHDSSKPVESHRTLKNSIISGWEDSEI